MEVAVLSIPLSAIPEDFHLKTSVMHAVDGPLESITVDHICERSGISRSKFYELFSSKYDIGYWYLTFVYDVSLGRIGRDLDWRDGIRLCLDLFDQERTYFTYTSETPENVRSLFWLVQGDRERMVGEVLGERGVTMTPKLQSEVRIYAKIVDLFLNDWVSSGQPLCSAEDFVDIWLGCVPRELYEGLQLP